MRREAHGGDLRHLLGDLPILSRRLAPVLDQRGDLRVFPGGLAHGVHVAAEMGLDHGLFGGEPLQEEPGGLLVLRVGVHRHRPDPGRRLALAIGAERRRGVADVIGDRRLGGILVDRREEVGLVERHHVLTRGKALHRLVPGEGAGAFRRGRADEIDEVLRGGDALRRADLQIAVGVDHLHAVRLEHRAKGEIRQIPVLVEPGDQPVDRAVRSFGGEFRRHLQQFGIGLRHFETELLHDAGPVGQLIGFEVDRQRPELSFADALHRLPCPTARSQDARREVLEIVRRQVGEGRVLEIGIERFEPARGGVLPVVQRRGHEEVVCARSARRGRPAAFRSRAARRAPRR